MKKALSQQEIDSLIHAISSGELDSEEINKEKETHRVRNYDFRRPNKLSKDHISAIKSIYDNYARMVTNLLSNQLRTDVEIKVVSIEQVSYGEFIKSIPNPTLLSFFRMEPLMGSFILEANPRYGFHLVDLLCGGSLNQPVEIREFTEIEISILEEILTAMIRVNKTAWADFLELEPVMDGLETNPQMNQTLSFGEAVTLITFQCQISEESTLLNLCIPYRALDQILENLHTNNYHPMGGSISDERFRSDIEEIISGGKVSLSVELGRTVITVEDFMDLMCGDVLQLDTGTGDPMKLYVEGRWHLYVQPGIHEQKLAVQVIDYSGKDVE